MYHIFFKIIPDSVLLFCIEHKYWLSQSFKKLNERFYVLYNKMGEHNLPVYDIDIWVKKLIKYCYAQKNKGIHLAQAFFEANISIVKSIDIGKDETILICPQKDDLLRMKEFINYHRKIGVNKFAVIDNDSTDGSLEWLKEQNDVFLFQTKDPYTTIRREAWINRIFAYFGHNRWYIVLDSDELLTYDDCENKSISELIKYFKSTHIKRGRALLLDMYAPSCYYKSGEVKDYLVECKYFDTDSYEVLNGSYLDRIQGGPRHRLFGTSSFLMKYPVVFVGVDDIECSSHFFFPYKDNMNIENNLVLRHYKFIPGDVDKYIDRLKCGNFSCGSKEYKQYLDYFRDNEDIDFMSNNSREYINSQSLRSINLYSQLNWKD